MITIIAATNREESVSSKLSQYIQKELLSLTDEKVELLDLKDLPEDVISSALYGNAGKNEVFNVMRDKVQQADKLYVVVPEYNGSFPGVLKVFIDGLEYPNSIRGKKAAMIGVSAGVLGSALAMSHLTDIFNYLGCSVLADKPRLTAIYKTFDGKKITDETMEGLVKEQLQAFINF